MKMHFMRGKWMREEEARPRRKLVGFHCIRSVGSSMFPPRNR